MNLFDCLKTGHSAIGHKQGFCLSGKDLFGQAQTVLYFPGMFGREWLLARLSEIPEHVLLGEGWYVAEEKRELTWEEIEIAVVNNTDSYKGSPTFDFKGMREYLGFKEPSDG